MGRKEGRMTTAYKGVIIVSGGLDSITLLYYLKKKLNKDVVAISYLYGQRNSKEIEFAKYHADLLGSQHQVINLTDIFRTISHSSALLGGMAIPTLEDVVGDPQPITYVPFRNMIMLSVAASVAESVDADRIYYGTQKHDEYSGYWDTTQKFTHDMQAVLDNNRKHKIKIEAPFIDKSKSDLVVIGTELEIDYTKTLTCYDGTNCGECPTCADRIQAFKRVGLKDPITYVRDTRTS
jgi:7-cyano-7-deazaguanine synthase